jgi:hypothetical protein
VTTRLGQAAAAEKREEEGGARETREREEIRDKP